jgi:hypothetical protein
MRNKHKSRFSEYQEESQIQKMLQSIQFLSFNKKLTNQQTNVKTSFKVVGSLILFLTFGLSFNSQAQGSYCTANTTYAYLDYASSFITTGATTNVNYSVGSNPVVGYLNQTTQPFAASPSQTINFSHTYSNASQPYGLRIWIDWNNDFDFTDAGENVIEQNGFITILGSFTVPANIPAGNYRMRVRSRFQAYPQVCGEELYGTTIDFTLAIAAIFTSPTLTQASGIPSCSAGTTISATGTPATGIQWYWQNTATGTSTATAYSGPRTITTNGSYFIRAFDAALNYWAPATTIAVSNFPLISSPPAPVADLNPSCIPSGTTLTVPAPPTGIVYYWQGTNVGGVSTALNASTAYNTIVTGTYYVAAYQASSQCWSNTVGIPVTVGTVIPANPVISQPNYNFCIGVPSVEIAATGGQIDWFSGLTGNNFIGSGSPFQTVGTSVLPSSATVGSYNFYASTNLNGCYSPSRQMVTVSLSNVNVTLTSSAVTCNNGNNGAVAIASVLCGTAPFTYSIDGGTFGPQTGMTPGPHTVKLKDALNNESGTYNVVIGNAPAPSIVTATSVTAVNANITWTATGSETQWNIEWGIPGFTPGIGAEIGSGTATSTNYLVAPLSPVNSYHIYVSANCGAGTTAGNWTLVSVNTLCAPIVALPWTENFDNLTTLGGASFPLCWFNENPGVWNTTNAPLSTLTSGPLSGANYLRVDYAANATIWTPEFDLVAGETYEFSFNWGGDTFSYWDGGVYVNGSQTFIGATSLGAKFVEIGDPTTLAYRPEIYCFTPTTSGIYTFGVKVIETGYNNYMSFDNFKLRQIATIPGIDGSLSICQNGSVVDLNTVITANATDGFWSSISNPTAVDSLGMFNTASVLAGVHQFSYITKGCFQDTTLATITVVEPSFAGGDSSLVVCRNQPINLLIGLTGSPDNGGIWLGQNATVVPNGNTIASNNSGQYTYTYIVSNGVCPADSAQVFVTVQGNCDYLGLEDVAFEAFSVYPNPSSDIFFIANSGSTAVFNYEILDMNGRVILKANNSINGSTTTELDLSKAEIGVYLLRIFNDRAEKTFRVVKN